MANGNPFPATAALHLDKADESTLHVPDHPVVSRDQTAVDAFLAQELSTPVLDELYPNLWCVARRSGGSIDPLHLQKIKGRDIVVAENPQLHLIWYNDKIYLKPIPRCLLSHSFWTAHLSSTTDNNASGPQNIAPRSYRSFALGFLRSYAHLVQHRSDFTLACQHQLIPENVGWFEWCEFIRHFRHIQDTRVARRYHYGQMQLSRLNWAVRLFQPQSASTMWFYAVPYWSIKIYVQRAVAPLIFGFATISLALSSMQVALATPADELGFGLINTSEIQGMKRVFWVFSIITLLLSGFIWILLFWFPFCVLAWQISWGYKNRDKEITRSPMLV